MLTDRPSSRFVTYSAGESEARRLLDAREWKRTGYRTAPDGGTDHLQPDPPRRDHRRTARERISRRELSDGGSTVVGVCKNCSHSSVSSGANISGERS